MFITVKQASEKGGISYELVAKVLAGQSYKSVAISEGISDGMLYTGFANTKN